jgi:hypothetical protein
MEAPRSSEHKQIHFKEAIKSLKELISILFCPCHREDPGFNAGNRGT